MKRLLSLYAAGLPFGFLLFCAGFRLGLFGSDPIVFYRGLKIAACSAAVQWAALGLAVRLWGRGLSPAHAFAATMASASLAVSFLIVVPVSLDRSVSVFLLGYMQNAGRPLTRGELEAALVDEYVRRDRAVDRRVAEQAASGNVVVGGDGRVSLTPQGRRFVLWSRMLAPTFSLSDDYLDPPVEGAPAR